MCVHSIVLNATTVTSDNKGGYNTSSAQAWSGNGYVVEMSADERDLQARQGVEATHKCIIPAVSLGAVVPLEKGTFTHNSGTYDIKGVMRKFRETSSAMNHWVLIGKLVKA
jgi:hypothetical protein